MTFSALDYVVFIGYCGLVLGVGYFSSRLKDNVTRTAQDYFLAGKSLPWWAVGTSLIASNISAQQFIGMTGSGYAIGLAIASYEWMAALTLLIVGKFFLPIYISRGIYTMPQFLENRFDKRVKTGIAIFFLLDFTFIGATSIIYLGALAFQSITGISLEYAIVSLALFAALVTLYGGQKAIAWTDVIQVLFLLAGGGLTTYLALREVGGGVDALTGLQVLVQKAPQKFDMILEPSHPFYKSLPGISVLVGGIWIANLTYWGLNQYIIQRALATKSIREAQRGVLLAGYLKLLMPLIVVVPGIAAYVLKAELAKPDEAYPWLLNKLLFPGVKGIVFAALIAGIVGSLGAISNSASTIFTLDIYKSFLNPRASEKTLVRVGRLGSAFILLVAAAVAPLLRTLDQVFQFIQEFGGFLAPGLLAVFLSGLFWKKATASAALWGLIVTIPLSVFFKQVIPQVPFMDRMVLVLTLVGCVIVLISLASGWKNDPKAIQLEKRLFRTDSLFNIAAIGLVAILILLYTVWW